MGRIQKLRKQRKDTRKEVRKAQEEFMKNLKPGDFLKPQPKFFLFRWVFNVCAFIVIKKDKC